MKPLVERHEREQIKDLLCVALEGQYDGGIRIDWLLKQGYSSIPVPEDHYFEAEAERIARALIDFSVSEILIVNWESQPEDFDFAFVSAVSCNKLMKISEKMHPFYFVLTDRALSFLIFCTKEEYHLVAGSREFVRAVLGTRLEDAVDAFRIHASETWGGDDEAHLLRVLARYEKTGT